MIGVDIAPTFARAALDLETRTPAGIGYAMFRFMSVGACESQDIARCGEISPALVPVPAGAIIAAIAGTLIARAPALVIPATFSAVGVGSLLGGLSDQAAGGRLFPILFGGAFLLGGLAPLAFVFAGFKKARRAVELAQTGRKAIATVTAVRDTGITINNNPRVDVTFTLAPLDGAPPYEASKKVTVNRVQIPRPGDRFPAWIAQGNPHEFAFGMLNDASARQQVIADFGFDPLAAPAQPETSGWHPPGEATATSPAAADGATGAVLEIERLAKLRREGAISDTEFASLKTALIQRATGVGDPPAGAT